MKKSKYQTSFDIGIQGVHLHYSSRSNSFVLMSEGLHKEYEAVESPEDWESFASRHPSQASALREGEFIVAKDSYELKWIQDIRQAMVDDTEMYNLYVNPTLDCNLDCWYCYENRIKGSRLSREVLDGIKRHINLKYEQEPFKCLKLSFFGGEPFVGLKGLMELLDYGASFCETRDIEFIADFTTNATLVTRSVVEALSPYRCHFQITLDGHRQTHNSLKKTKVSSFSAYDRTIDALRLISENIPNHWIAVRINFSNETLKEIEKILDDIDFLDRRKTYVILKKVWQLDVKDVDKPGMIAALDAIFAHRFLPDYYYMPKGCVCFAERKNQVLINYDGGVFKCTTLPSFTSENALGDFDVETGAVTWHEDKTRDWYADMQPGYCLDCELYPACMGICNRQIMTNRPTESNRICTFDAMNLTRQEYLMYLFRYKELQNEIYR